MRRLPKGRAGGLAAAVPLAGCSGVQSALAPSGQEAIEISRLFWTVTGIGVAVTLIVGVVTAVALFGPRRWRARIADDRVIVAGGIVFPVVVLSGLLIYGFLVMQAGAAREAKAIGPGVTIIGKLWWWEVIYTGPDGEQVVSANELRLPVGRPTALRLQSDNVIHSFWAPQLAGKLDMIPGRTNVLTVEPTEAAASRGQCAEYCGGAHALMSFHVVSMEPADYEAWLAHEAAPAQDPQTDEQRLGQTLFMESGCGACHAIRGTEARGTIGPDLTHVGSRMSLAAAVLPNTQEAFARWIVDNQHIKPQNKMPPFGQFAPDQLAALAAYLDSLE